MSRKKNKVIIEDASYENASEIIDKIISKEVMERDIIVNLPKFKTRDLTTINGSIKNMFDKILVSEDGVALDFVKE